MMSDVATRTDSDILRDIRAEIYRQADEGYETLDMDDLMKIVPWSRRQFERQFRAQFLTSPMRYFRDVQAECARNLLKQGVDVLTTSTRSGFTSPGRLHDVILSRYGLTPGQLRRKGEGVSIRFGFFDTQLGIVLIAGTERGISSLMLTGIDPTGAEILDKFEELKATFPGADICEDIEMLKPYADMLVDFLADRIDTFNPPLDIIQGTTFQREVWAELRKVKPGETATYSEIAERIGKPKAYRAVANACANNNCAIAIPCHRIIRSDGTISGYRWGIEWKEKLLQIEAQKGKEQYATL